MNKIISILLFSFAYLGTLSASQHYVNSIVSCKSFAKGAAELDVAEGVQLVDLTKNPIASSLAKNPNHIYIHSNKNVSGRLKEKSKSRLARFYQSPNSSILFKITNKNEMKKILNNVASEHVGIRYELESQPGFKRNFYPEYDAGMLSVAWSGLAYINYMAHTYPGLIKDMSYLANVNLLMVAASAYSFKKLFDYLDKKVEPDLRLRLAKLNADIEGSKATFFHIGKTEKVLIDNTNAIPKYISSMEQMNGNKDIVSAEFKKLFQEGRGESFSFDLFYSSEEGSSVMYFGVRRGLD